MNKQKIESIWALLAVLCVKKKEKKEKKLLALMDFLASCTGKGVPGDSQGSVVSVARST